MKHGRSQPISAYTSTPLLHLHVLCCFAALASLLSVLSPVRAASDADDIAKYCPTECSGLPVHYPFGTVPAPGASSRLRCGSPAFQLRCDGHSAVWDAQSVSALQITAINYTSRSIDVRDNLMSNCTEFTPLMPQLLNLDQQFNFTPFTIANVSVSTSVRILVFGCSPLPTLDSVSGFTYSSTACQTFYSSCLKGQAEIPAGCFEAVSILADIASLVGKYGCSYYTSFYNLPSPLPPSFSFPADNTGVQLLWANVDHQDACDKCVSTNGKCGFDEKVSQRFVCLCSGSKYSSTNCSAPDLLDFPAGCSGSLCGRNLKLAIALPIVAFMAVLGATFYCVIWRRKKRSMMGRSNSSFISNDSNKELAQVLADQVGPLPTKLFTYKELQQATNSFSESRMLGDGGFGAVYEGRLRDGRKVAVKRLYHDNYRRLEQFFNEIRILSSLQHPNLVKLYGFCYEDHRDLLLVYEFVSNGTLAESLHGDGGKGLPWETRLNMAVETAEALAYLHYSVNPPIFHRDVKPTNILIDENFHVKVADFGLSRLVPLEVTHISTAPQGTPGYLDPDYHQCYQLTDKSDVYSFGVVLMEIISAKPAVDMSRERTEINLSSLAVSKIQSGALEELVDPLLEISRYPRVKHMVTRVAGLALQCLALHKDDRPSMREVADELERIRQFDNGDIIDVMKFESINSFDSDDKIILLKHNIPFSPTSVHTKWSSSSTSSSDRSSLAM